MKKCPFCAEEIQDAAIKCKHCGSILNGAVDKTNPISQTQESVPKNIDSGLQVQKRRNALASLIAGLALVLSIVVGIAAHSGIAFLGICVVGLVISLVVYFGG